MNRASLTRRALLAACLCVAIAALSISLRAQSLDAREIMRQVYSQTASQSVQTRASFEVFDREGHSTKKQFDFKQLNTSAGNKALAVFTAPAEIRGVALLSIQQPGQPSLQYMYTPATQRVRSVAAQERSSRFIGTDFSYEEIGEHSVDDFNYRLLSDQEKIDGRKAYKIEARPVDSSRSQYQYIYYWVAQDAPVILFAQMYNAQGVATRLLHATDIRRDKGVWGARRTEVSTPAESTRTVLFIEDAKFNQPLDEAMFTPQGLAALNETKHK
jgi:hypothetical protein